MMGTPLFDNRPAQAGSAIELRRATFDDDAEMTLTQGLTLVSFRRIGIAINDIERCKRPHLRVLHCLMRNLHHATGTAFCSRRFLAEDLELTEKTIENVLYDLRQWGYIDWERRAAPELHPGRRLLHYVQPVCRWSEDEITKAIRTLRGLEVPVPAATKSTRPKGDYYSKVPVLTGTKTPLPSGELPLNTTRPNGDFSNGSTRPDGEFPPKSTRPGGVSNSSLSKEERREDEVEAVLAAFKEVVREAANHGVKLAPCHGLSAEQKTKLHLTIGEVGGLQDALKALRAIPLSDYAMGRKPKAAGGYYAPVTLHRLINHASEWVELLNLALNPRPAKPVSRGRPR